jgi:hypothetical protein
MKRIAYILADGTDSPEAIADLRKHLELNEIQPICLDWSELFLGIYHRNYPEKGLFYRNPYIRIENPKETLDFFLKHNFDALYYKSNLEFLAFDPQKALLEHARFYMPSPHTSFIVQSEKGVGTQSMVGDSSPYPTIVMYTHSRSTYFEMTFNSLIFSLDGDKNYPIKLMVNGEENVKNVASFIGSRYTQYDIEILVCRENAYLGSCNALVKYFDLDAFIAMEDDIILPQLLKYHVPHWPKQFMNRLSLGHDVVGFVAETYNRPLSHVWPSPPLSEQGGWYVGNPDNILPIMGQCIATTRENYMKHINPKNMCASDETLLKASQKHCAPWIRPYHIGWNATMDYVKKIERPETVGIVTIESLRSGITKRINLLDS